MHTKLLSLMEYEIEVVLIFQEKVVSALTIRMGYIITPLHY